MGPGLREGLSTMSATSRVRDQVPRSSPRHSLWLGALVPVAAPTDGLGPLLVVTQVPLYHVVVSSAPTAIFSELDTCGGAGCDKPGPARPPLPDGSLGTVCYREPGGPIPSTLGLCTLLPTSLSEEDFPDRPVSQVPGVAQVGTLLWLAAFPHSC